MIYETKKYLEPGIYFFKFINQEHSKTVKVTLLR